MKITRVEMYSGAEPVAEFNISDLASKSPFVAKAITGLDASEITPVFSGNSLDGQGGFYEFSLPARQIAIRTALRQDLHHELRTVSNLRDELYRAISATRMGIVEIRFCNGADVEAVIYGRVVKMEVDHFSKYAEAQVTLQCDDPFLYGPSSVVVTPDQGLDLTGLIRQVEFFDSVSTAPHGMVLQVNAVHDYDVLTLSDPSRNAVFEINVLDGVGGDTHIRANSLVRISSEHRSRFVQLFPQGAGVPIRIADKIGLHSMWPLTFPGKNVLVLEAWLHGERAVAPVVVSVEWLPRFWGV